MLHVFLDKVIVIKERVIVDCNIELLSTPVIVLPRNHCHKWVRMLIYEHIDLYIDVLNDFLV